LEIADYIAFTLLNTEQRKFSEDHDFEYKDIS